MKARSAICALWFGVLLHPLAEASPSEEVERRAVMPNNRAQAIAAELFPEQCGSGGQSCGIIYGPEFCPLQFAITFPRSTELPNGGAVAFVTVDPRGSVIEVKFSKDSHCRKGGGIAS